MEEKTNWWNWLAIASFVLALVWWFLCLIIIWLPLWILCLILELLLYVKNKLNGLQFFELSF